MFNTQLTAQKNKAEEQRLLSDIKERLKLLSGKENISLVSRGNSAIFQALLVSKLVGKKKVFIPDQGGWLTYKTLPSLAGLDVVEFDTDNGKFDVESLKGLLDHDSVLLISSLAGYSVKIDTESISAFCKEKECLFIDDISGSVGGGVSHADIVVCSFGKWKPINVGFGGFIAVSSSLSHYLSKMKFDRFSMDNGFNLELLSLLQRKLENLKKRVVFLHDTCFKVRKDLNKKYEIIHPDDCGLNVLVAFDSSGQKNNLIDYCAEQGYRYTICPRYIRVNRDAISIEIKQL